MTRGGTCCRRLHVELARSSGALSELPIALNSRVYIHLFRGELDTAAALIDEARVATEATGAGLTPWGAVALAALRGREPTLPRMLDVAAADATQRGEGIGLTVIALGAGDPLQRPRRHDEALAAAQEAIDCPTNSAAPPVGAARAGRGGGAVGEPERGARGRRAVRGDRDGGRDRLGARGRGALPRAA